MQMLRDPLSRESRRLKTKATRWFVPSVAIDSPTARTFHLFELSTGTFGISPKNVHYDDVICNFSWLEVTILLRRSSTANYYNVVTRVVLFERLLNTIPNSSADWLLWILNGNTPSEEVRIEVDDLVKINLRLGMRTLKWCTSTPDSMATTNPYL
jgi:hypothetical protein